MDIIEEILDNAGTVVDIVNPVVPEDTVVVVITNFNTVPIGPAI
jgi:hypothetical protein